MTENFDTQIALYANRVPAGVPTGGQFAASQRAESGVTLPGTAVHEAIEALHAVDPSAPYAAQWGACPDCNGPLPGHLGEGKHLPGARCTTCPHTVAEMEVYSVATDEDGSYAYSLDAEGSIGVYDPDGDCVEVWTVDDPSWVHEATHFGVDKATVTAALAQRDYEVARTDRIDALVDDLQAIEADVDAFAEEREEYDASKAIRALNDATEAAWDAFDDSGARDARGYSRALHRIAENQVWDVASAFGYNTDMHPDDLDTARAANRDAYLGRRFGDIQDRLKGVSQGFWDLDRDTLAATRTGPATEAERRLGSAYAAVAGLEAEYQGLAGRTNLTEANRQHLRDCCTQEGLPVMDDVYTVLVERGAFTNGSALLMRPEDVRRDYENHVAPALSEQPAAQEG